MDGKSNFDCDRHRDALSMMMMLMILFHCRYIDDIFMTTNRSIDEIQVELSKARTKDLNIRIEPNISQSVSFLDVSIMNVNGQLSTKLYHKPTAEPYYLPYTSDHPHRIHRNIPYSALLRAARFTSNIADFNRERLRIDLALLLNHYPPKMLTNQYLRFFQVHRAEPVLQRLDRTHYQYLHRQVLDRETKQDITFKTLDKKQLVLHPPVMNSKSPWDRTLLFLSYTYESGPGQNFSRTFNDWWKKNYLYPGSPATRINVRLAVRNNPTLKKRLIRKRPPTHILQRIEQRPPLS